MYKKFILLMITVALLLSSCDQTSPTAIPVLETAAVEVAATEAIVVAPDDDNSVILNIYLLDYTPDTIAWLEETVNPAFEKQFPDVGVDIIQGSWLDWQNAITGFFSENAGPDIINLGSEMNMLYGENLADMEPYLGENVWPEIKNFGPALESAKYEGKIRGLPIFTSPRFIFCRKDLMEAAGWATGTPANFTEWVDFARKASKIDSTTKSLVQQALVPMDAGSMADWQWWLLVFESLGGTLYKDDGTPNFDSPEALAAAQFLLDMRQATYGPVYNAVAPLPAGQGSVIDVNDETGKDNGAVCLMHSNWAAPASSRAIWETISIDAFAGDPANFPNSKPVVLAYNNWLAVPEYSQNKELAAEWLKMAFSKEANNKWNETMGFIPARVDSQYGFMTQTVHLRREGELANQYGVGFSGILEPAKLSTIIQNVLVKLIREEVSPEEAVIQIQTEYSEVIEKLPE